MTFNGYRVNNLYTMQNIITYFSDCADDLLLNYQDYDKSNKATNEAHILLSAMHDNIDCYVECLYDCLAGLLNQMDASFEELVNTFKNNNVLSNFEGWLTFLIDWEACRADYLDIKRLNNEFLLAMYQNVSAVTELVTFVKNKCEDSQKMNVVVMRKLKE